MLTLWDDLLKETNIEPVNPPPEMPSDILLPLTLPDAVPDALKVRSSHSPDGVRSQHPRCAMKWKRATSSAGNENPHGAARRHRP